MAGSLLVVKSDPAFVVLTTGHSATVTFRQSLCVKSMHLTGKKIYPKVMDGVTFLVKSDPGVTFGEQK